MSGSISEQLTFTTVFRTLSPMLAQTTNLSHASQYGPDILHAPAAAARVSLLLVGGDAGWLCGYTYGYGHHCCPIYTYGYGHNCCPIYTYGYGHNSCPIYTYGYGHHCCPIYTYGYGHHCCPMYLRGEPTHMHVLQIRDSFDKFIQNIMGEPA